MGHPKRPRKKYETPSHPWQEDRIKHENELMRKYGLKNKREIWKAQTQLKRYRNLARSLLAKVGSEDEQYKREVDQLLSHLARLDILKTGASLDDVLALNEEHILSRRLQTIVYLKGLASTPKQARQLIVHGHIAVDGRRVTVPSYMVKGDEEGEIDYAPDSPLVDVSHPARPPVDLLKSRKPVAVKTVEEDSSKVEGSEKSVSSESSESEKTPVEPVSPESGDSSVEPESSGNEVDTSPVDGVDQGGK
ncbi:MAG TPA: 30S ribosomal protein S4 [Thermoplasmatales archaeon]|nr:30S ribosomal protein S4 [Thermoplasmatales archaeon]